MNPFTTDKSKSVQALGEVALIEKMRQWLGDASPPSPEGIGDDCAVMTPESGKKLLVSTDMLVWGRHFDESANAEQAGVKLFKRNLSDIAAMGGEPRGAVVALLLSEDISLAWLEGFYRGMVTVASQYDVLVMGGDISHVSNQHFSATMTVLGQAKRPVRRQYAQVGETLWVTGALGGSLHGRHLSFEPRIKAGQWLAARDNVRVMMDVSDGLAKDLPALLGAQCIGKLDTANIPIHADALEASRESGRSALAHAMEDGEDYELLFSLDGKSDVAAFKKAFEGANGLEAHCIGEVAAREAETQPALVDASGDALVGKGYEYFR